MARRQQSRRRRNNRTTRLGGQRLVHNRGFTIAAGESQATVIITAGQLGIITTRPARMLSIRYEAASAGNGSPSWLSMLVQRPSENQSGSQQTVTTLAQNRQHLIAPGTRNNQRLRVPYYMPTLYTTDSPALAFLCSSGAGSGNIHVNVIVTVMYTDPAFNSTASDEMRILRFDTRSESEYRLVDKTDS